LASYEASPIRSCCSGFDRVCCVGIQRGIGLKTRGFPPKPPARYGCRLVCDATAVPDLAVLSLDNKIRAAAVELGFIAVPRSRGARVNAVGRSTRR